MGGWGLIFSHLHRFRRLKLSVSLSSSASTATVLIKPVRFLDFHSLIVLDLPKLPVKSISLLKICNFHIYLRVKVKMGKEMKERSSNTLASQPKPAIILPKTVEQARLTLER